MNTVMRGASRAGYVWPLKQRSNGRTPSRAAKRQLKQRTVARAAAPEGVEVVLESTIPDALLYGELVQPEAAMAMSDRNGTADVRLHETVDLTPLYTELEHRSTRPFMPDLQGAVESLMGGTNKLWVAPDARAAVDALIGPPDGAPRLVRLKVPRPAGSPDPSQLPIMFYLPGIDGTGLAAWRQFNKLAGKFDLQALVIPPDDRTDFEGLVKIVQEHIEREVLDADVNRPVYVMGESFGCLLSIAVAVKCRSLVDRLVLVNPASSFQRTPWPIAGQLLPQMPKEIYGVLPFIMSPVLTNPFSIASSYIDRSAGPADQLSDFAYGMVKLIPELGDLRKALPPPTLAFRLQLLAQGCAATEAILLQVQQRVLVLAGELDLLIPSAEEAKRLVKKMPACRSRVVAGKSHAMLQEAGVDLAAILEQEGFYVQTRRLTSTSAGPRSTPRTRAAATGIALELPTRTELNKFAQDLGLQNIRRAVSPVFLSTNEDGRIERGLGAIPDSRPLLFVGNHSLLDTSMPLMVQELLLERDIFLRGLAHPTISSDNVPDMLPNDPEESARMRNLFRAWGAVPVSPKNIHTLLQQGEAALLYPGGAAEALKPRNGNYKLIWPERSEFVRMAARHGATIIPFSVVGADEVVVQLLDSQELGSLPIVGEWYRQRASLIQSRTGVNAVDGPEQTFGMPLAVPNAPPRFYHLFGKPIRTSPDMARDKQACGKVYAEVREQVESGVDYLLRKREQDPYKDVGPRLLYEAARGWQSQAPTFPL